MSATETLAAVTMIAIILLGFLAMYTMGRMHGEAAARRAAQLPVSVPAVREGR